MINALAAAAVGCAVGLDLARIAAGLEAARPIKGRCVWRRAGTLRVLDDTYNANPVSVAAALDTLAAGADARRRVVVLGDMLELGELAEGAHREAGRAVAASGAVEFVGMGAHARVAVEAARQAGLVESHHTTTFEDTVALLLKRLAPGDALLVKGSRGRPRVGGWNRPRQDPGPRRSLPVRRDRHGRHGGGGRHRLVVRP